MGLAKSEDQYKMMRHDHLLNCPNRCVCGNRQAAPGKPSILPTDDVRCHKASWQRKGDPRAKALTETLGVILNNTIKDNDIAKSIISFLFPLQSVNKIIWPTINFVI